MPQSFSNVLVHAVFSTKNRYPYLADSGSRKEVFAYLGGVSKSLGCPIVAIGGVADHAHVLFYLGRMVSVAEWIKEVKRISSSFAKDRVSGFSWQSGYGAFTVDRTSIDRVANYIRNQEEHHRKESYQDEFRRLLAEQGIEWDERYVWD